MIFQNFFLQRVRRMFRTMGIGIRFMLVFSVIGMSIRVPVVLPVVAATGTWNTTTSPTTAMLTDSTVLSSTDAWAVGSSGSILRWNGTTWTSVTSPTSQWLWGLDASASNNVWAVGDTGTVLQWNGSVWTVITAPTSEHLLGVSVLSASNVWVVGEAGSLFQWNGITWADYSLSDASGEIFYDIDFTSPTNGWVVGSNGQIRQWNGSVWSAESSNTSDALFSVAALTTSNAWAVGENGTIRQWNGSTWASVTSPTDASLLAVAMHTADDGWIVGDDGTILSTMDGVAWISEISPTHEALSGVGLALTGSGWSVGTNGTILRHSVPPSAPTLTSPEGTINDATPTMEWSAVADTTSYTLDISSTESFTSPTHVTGISGVTYTVPDALTDGAYYWRVQAVGLGGTGSFSSPMTFAVATIVPETPDTVAPSVPVLISPANEEEIIPTASLSWQPSVDPEGSVVTYSVRIADEPTFTSPIATLNDTQETTISIPNGAVEAGVYYWHVVAKDAAGNTSNPSSYRTVTVLPSLGVVPLLTPAVDIITNTASVTFTWQPLDYATTYHLEIDAQGGTFNPPAVYTGNVASTSQDVSLSSGIYQWRVIAENARGRGAAPALGRVLTVDRDAPSVVQQVSPVGGVVIDTATPTLTWASSIEPDVVGYEVQVYRSDAQPTAFASVSGTQFIVNLPLNEAAYTWRVRAVDAAGNTSTVAIADFSIKIAKSKSSGDNEQLLTPESFSLREPALSTSDSTPLFTWTSSANVIAYEVRLMRGDTTVKTAVVEGSTEYQMITPLEDGAYTWSVTAYNGARTAVAGPRNVMIDTIAPTKPELLTPEPNADKSFPIIFTWLPADDTSSVTYYLQVDDDHFSIPEAFLSGGADVEAALAKSLEVSVNGLAATSYPVIGGLRVGLSYRWRVRALDSLGHSTLSEVREFTIPLSAYAPEPFSLSSPAQQSPTVRPTFVWTPSAYAVRYGLHIQGVGAQSALQFSYPADGETPITTTSFTVPTDIPNGSYTWHVRATNSAGERFSETRLLTIGGVTPPTDVPTIVVLSTPDHDARIGSIPTFTWEPVDGATTYTLTINGSTVADHLIATSYEPTKPLSEGSVKWQVQAVNDIGSGTPSEIRTAVVDTTSPSAPTALEPSEGSQEPVITDLRWQAVLDPSAPIRYEVVIDDEAGFVTPLATVPFSRLKDVTISTAAFGVPLIEGRTYYWRVRAEDAAGNVSPVSVTKSFVTVAASTLPGSVTLVSPTDTATVGGQPFLDWSDARGALRYTIRLQQSATGATRLVETGSIASMYDIALHSDVVVTEGTYQWAVQAVNNVGAGPWSASQTFVVDQTPPARPAALTPSDGERRSSVCTPFAWSTVDDAASYDFELDANRDTLSADRGAAITRRALTTTAIEQALASGTYAWRVRAMDTYGNASVWSTIRSVTINGVTAAAAAAATCVASVDSAGVSESGPDQTVTALLDQPTTFATSKPSLRGIVSARNTTLQALIDGQAVANVAIDGTGKFQFDMPIRLSDGTHTVQFAIGSVVSVAVPFSIDTTAPEAPVVEDVSVIRQQVSDVPGTMDILILVLRARVDADTAEVSLVDPVTNEVLLRQDAPENRLFTATVNRHALAPGGHTFLVVARDAYGNVSHTRAEYLVSTDVIAYACSDEMDNDTDGMIDYPFDPGCSGYTDTDEQDSVFVSIASQKTVKAVTNAVSDATKATVTVATDATKAAVRRTIEQTAAVAEVTEQAMAAAQPVAMTALTAAAPIMTVASPLTAASLPAIPSMAMNGLSWLFSALGIKRKRKEPWGVVYDSITKEPIGLAIIRLYEQASGRLVATQVTDQQGRFEFLAKAGTYRFEVVKTPFVFPSKLVTGAQDGEYADVYRGGEVTVREGQPMHMNIPVDPEDPRKRMQAVTMQQRFDQVRKLFQKLSLPIMIAGTAFAIVMFAFSQTQFNFLILLVYVAMAVFQILIVPQQGKAWGTVFDAATLEPVPLAIISVIDPEFKRVMKSRLTDYHGRFSFLPDPGSYQLRVTKQGYTFPSTTPVTSHRYKNVYHGEKIVIEKKKGGKIAADIPVDAVHGTPSAAVTPSSVQPSQPSVASSVTPPPSPSAPTGTVPGIAQPPLPPQPSTPTTSSSGPLLPGTGGGTT